MEWNIQQREIVNKNQTEILELRNTTNEIKTAIGPGMVAQACNPSTLGAWGGWITRSRGRDHHGQHGETLSLLKIQKISWAWWHVPVIPATQELRQENCLNPGGGGCGEPRSCHCTPAWVTRVKLHLKIIIIIIIINGNRQLQQETQVRRTKNLWTYRQAFWNYPVGVKINK